MFSAWSTSQNQFFNGQTLEYRFRWNQKLFSTLHIMLYNLRYCFYLVVTLQISNKKITTFVALKDRRNEKKKIFFDKHKLTYQKIKWLSTVWYFYIWDQSVSEFSGQWNILHFFFFFFFTNIFSQCASLYHKILPAFNSLIKMFLVL